MLIKINDVDLDLFNEYIRVKEVSTNTPAKKFTKISMLDFSGDIDVTNRVFGNQYEDREITVTINIVAPDWNKFSRAYDELLSFLYYPTEELDVFIASKGKRYFGRILDGFEEIIHGTSAEITFNIITSPLENYDVKEPDYNNFDVLNWRYGFDQAYDFYNSSAVKDPERPEAYILKVGKIEYDKFKVDPNTKIIRASFTELFPDNPSAWKEIRLTINDTYSYLIPKTGVEVKLPASIFNKDSDKGFKNKLTFEISGTDVVNSYCKIHLVQQIEAL